MPFHTSPPLAPSARISTAGRETGGYLSARELADLARQDDPAALIQWAQEFGTDGAIWRDAFVDLAKSADALLPLDRLLTLYRTHGAQADPEYPADEQQLAHLTATARVAWRANLFDVNWLALMIAHDPHPQPRLRWTLALFSKMAQGLRLEQKHLDQLEATEREEAAGRLLVRLAQGLVHQEPTDTQVPWLEDATGIVPSVDLWANWTLLVENAHPRQRAQAWAWLESAPKKRSAFSWHDTLQKETVLDHLVSALDPDATLDRAGQISWLPEVSDHPRIWAGLDRISRACPPAVQKALRDQWPTADLPYLTAAVRQARLGIVAPAVAPSRRRRS